MDGEFHARWRVSFEGSVRIVRKVHRMMATVWRPWVLAALAVMSPAAIRLPAAPDDVDSLRQALYDYDATLPLDAAVGPAPLVKNEPPKLKALRSRHLVKFTSACDQRVPAILSLPLSGAKPRGAVILLAGSGGHKDTDYVRLASDMLNTMGLATLSIDAQYHGDRARKGRSGDIHLIHLPTNRDAWIQTVRDLRRSVDYLCSRTDIDASRIGFLGFSQGAMVGGTFIGVEPRIKAACLAVGGAGFVEWAAETGAVPSSAAERLRIGAMMTDPIYFVGRFAPRPLLILAARRDELIPASATERLARAAGDGKTLIWYNSGHLLAPNAILIDARGFFDKHLARP